MSHATKLSLLAGAAALSSSAGTVFADSEAWTSGLTADETRSLVAEMMSDAETRSSLLQSGGAGHDGKFFLASPDGAFRLNVEGQVQFRYIADFRDDDDPDDFEGGFQTRRTKLNFNGTIYDTFFYAIQGAFDRGGDGSFNLEDAYFGVDLDNGSYLRWGQFKLAYLREENVSSKYQLAVDRSLVNEAFTQGYSQGVEWGWKNEDIQVRVSFSDGFNSANSDVGSANESDYAFTGRFDWKFAGTWDQFKDFTSMPGSEYAGLLGLAAHYEGSGSPAARGSSASLFGLTADVGVEGDGWNFYAAGVWTSSDDGGIMGAGLTPPGGNSSADDYGIIVQGGVFLPDTDWEIFGRWDILFPDDNRDPDDNFNTLTFGVNNYIHGHSAKFTFDVVYYVDDMNSVTGPNTGLGYFGSVEEGEVTLRAQFQLLF